MEEKENRNQDEILDKKFGRLRVLGAKGKNSWLCRCDCGKEIVVRGCYLKSGHTGSCGCLRIYRHPERDVGLRLLYYRYKCRAKRAKREFSISLDKFKVLTKKNCFYCGRGPCSVSKSKSRHSEYVYNGLDRIDSKKGYSMVNVVTCCVFCNRMKLHYTQYEFREFVRRIYRHWAR
jgi:hypothetical protein